MKLMFVDMLGFPTHFGQMEVLKLVAAATFPEKRIGYLALMVLLDENTEVLMLATQTIKNDLDHENPYVVALALCALGNIASKDMARDLGHEVEKCLRSPNPYIRKKACTCASRLVQKVPSLCEEFFKAALQVVEDKVQAHGPIVGAIQLLIEIIKITPK